MERGGRGGDSYRSSFVRCSWIHKVFVDSVVDLIKKDPIVNLEFVGSIWMILSPRMHHPSFLLSRANDRRGRFRSIRNFARNSRLPETKLKFLF